ncbi:MAG TPA: histidine phosphatase family protein [Alcanivoracaceae bacterium]|nr:histidine phosphatase family protein [Alcanivoracaceae bacterium]
MKNLHPMLMVSQKFIPSNVPVHLLTRHSLREQPQNEFADGSVPLTEEGVELAYKWGQQLALPIGGLFSSPMGRCIDTATHMAAGAKDANKLLLPHPVEPVVRPTLVEPGCFVADIKLAGPEFFRLGAQGFINGYLAEAVPGVLTPRAGLSKLASYLYQHQVEAASLAVHVTHDTVLAAFVSALQGKPRIEAEDWPWMMEGLWCWFDAEGMHWIWRGEQGVLPLQFHRHGGVIAT